MRPTARRISSSLPLAASSVSLAILAIVRAAPCGAGLRSTLSAASSVGLRSS